MRKTVYFLVAMFAIMSSSAYAEDITARCNKGGMQQQATCSMQAEMDNDNYDALLAYDMLVQKSFNCANHPAVEAASESSALAALKKCINEKHTFMNDMRKLMEKYGYPPFNSAEGKQMYPENDEALINYLINRRERLGFPG